jgi:hypothetical protein
VAVQLGADKEHPPVHPRADERVGHLQPIDERRALLANVEARAAGLLGNAELVLEHHAGAREVKVRRQRAEDDAVELLRGDAGIGERAPRGREREVAGRDRAVVGHVAPRLDTGPLLDPLVIGLHLLRVLAPVPIVQERKLVVIDDAVRDVATEPQDLRAHHVTWI